MAQYDWDYWRHKYVTGDDSVTLEALSKIQNAPAFISLRKRAAAESWAKQRENFRLQKYTSVSSDPATIQAAEQVNKLVDIAEIYTRQTKIAKAFQALSARWLQQADPSQLKGSEAIAMFRDAAKIEQLLAGMATEHQEITSGGQPLKPTRIEIVPLADNPDSTTP